MDYQGVLIGFTVALGYGVLHSLMATHWAKGLARRAFGPLGDRFYRLAYNALALVTLVPVLLIIVRLPGSVLYWIGWPWVALTLAVQVLATLAIVAGLTEVGILRFLGFRPFPTGPEGQTSGLTVDGIYAWVRNPLYIAGLVIIWLLPIMTTTLLGLNIGLTLYTVVGSRLEAGRMLRELGEDYAAYQREVPAFLPRFRRK